MRAQSALRQTSKMLARVYKSAQTAALKPLAAKKVASTPAFYGKKQAPLNKSFLRAYSEHHGLSHEEVSTRVIEVIKSFNKVDPNAVTAHSHFQKDLGLDSLEQVELILNIEDEFAVDIPDAESEKIQSAEDAINYIVAHPHAK